MIDQLSAEIQVLDDALRANEHDIARLQNKLREARSRQNNIMTRLESAENRVKLRTMYTGDKVREAFSRFDIMERRVDEAEGRADALSLGENERKVLGHTSLEDEFAALADSDQVDAELAAMKKTMNSKKDDE